jgi:hypothetical protein
MSVSAPWKRPGANIYLAVAGFEAMSPTSVNPDPPDPTCSIWMEESILTSRPMVVMGELRSRSGRLAGCCSGLTTWWLPLRLILKEGQGDK